jgi:heptosyltransferase-2
MKSTAQVVIQTAFLGDLILTIPFFLKLKELKPNEKIILICKKNIGDFLLENKLIDVFIEIEKNKRSSYQEALKALEEYTISDLYCIHRSIRSLLFAFQIKAKIKIGYKSFLGSFVFTETYTYQKSWPDAIRKFSLLQNSSSEIKKALTEPQLSELNLADTNGVLPCVPDIFSFKKNLTHPKSKKMIALFPGSVWETKRWTTEGFTEVAQKLQESGYEIHLLGGPDEKVICDEIALKLPEAHVLAGRLSIKESIQQIEKYALVIANDSAATHMSAFKNIPCVTVFGPTTLDLGFRPWSNQALVVQNNHLNCRPCGAHGHHQCPLGHHHCMKLITANEVFEKAQKLLALNFQ